MHLSRRPWLPLLLLVPAPSLGILAALYLAPGPVGQGLFGLSKLWLILFPLAWTLLVDREPHPVSPSRKGHIPSCDPAPSPISVCGILRRVRIPAGRFHFRCRGYVVGLISGLLIALIIVVTGIAVGGAWIDLPVMRTRLFDAGLGRPMVYLAGSVYWCLINALIEEYVWRWFVFQQALRLVGSRHVVWFSAILFTVHHILALAAFTDWRVTLIASTGVFIGGVIWAALRQRTGAIWPGYLSHVLADVGVFVAGWVLLFGGESLTHVPVTR